MANPGSSTYPQEIRSPLWWYEGPRGEGGEEAFALRIIGEARGLKEGKESQGRRYDMGKKQARCLRRV
jgi:hypothetical protein